MPTRPKAADWLPPRETGIIGQFEEDGQEREASLLGMWTFLASEIMFFGALFAGYLIYRMFYAQDYLAAAGHLDRVLGSLNTAILLVSSVAMSLAIRYSQAESRGGTVACLLSAAFLGAAFIVIKGYEYHKEAVEGLVPFTGWDFRFTGADPAHARLFFTQYFIMTGLHALHLAIGVAIAAYLAFRTLSGRGVSRGRMGVELGALYWHFVDIVWIFLFPMLYLSR